MPDGIGIGARFATYADLLILFGLAAFALHSPGAARIDVRRWSRRLAGLGIMLSLFGLWISAASMAGAGLDAVDAETLRYVLLETPLGMAGLVRIAALVVVMLPQRWPRMIAAAVALGSLAWSGHAASNMDVVQLGADVVHLLAAGAWIGALVAFLRLLFSAPSDVSAAALRRFSGVGSLIVALLLATGIVNGWMILGGLSPSAILASLYGQLLAAKIAAFALMLACAAANRFWLVPAMGGRTERLKISVGVETLAGVAVLALVAWLGTLAPPG